MLEIVIGLYIIAIVIGICFINGRIIRCIIKRFNLDIADFMLGILVVLYVIATLFLSYVIGCIVLY